MAMASKPKQTTTSMLARYAGLGVPLGFLGLPLYMHLPHYYATSYGISLSVLGAIFLASRLVDCAADPWFGRWLDGRSARIPVIAAAVVSAAGMGLLFSLPLLSATPPSPLFITGLLVATYLGYSVLSIRFYASGVALASDGNSAARVSSWREGMIILGVLLGAAGPGLQLSYVHLALLFGVLLAVALWLGRHTLLAPHHDSSESTGFTVVLSRHGVLYTVFFFNALAPAITATLYLFYIEEVLGSANYAAPFLLVYFIAAIAAMPLWVKLSHRFGRVRCLTIAMLMAILSFVQASQLSAGDDMAFLAICLLTGFAFGADASLLPSLLSDDLSHHRTSEHSAFGIWMAISKLTLALAAGLALPAVEVLQDHSVVRADALRYSYGLLPCVIKCIALAALIFYHQRRKGMNP